MYTLRLALSEPCTVSVALGREKQILANQSCHRSVVQIPWGRGIRLHRLYLSDRTPSDPPRWREGLCAVFGCRTRAGRRFFACQVGCRGDRTLNPLLPRDNPFLADSSMNATHRHMNIQFSHVVRPICNRFNASIEWSLASLCETELLHVATEAPAFLPTPPEHHLITGSIFA